MSLLERFLFKVQKLNRANTPYGKAPHKPILLLSIIELFDKGVICDNRVYIDTDLVGTFQENWRLLVNTSHRPDFTQPFYYLQSEKLDGISFWHLQPQPGCQINAYVRSVETLSSVLLWGFFSNNVYELFIDHSSRQLIKHTILDTYFPQNLQKFTAVKSAGRGYFHELESFVLNEPDVRYKTVKVEYEEDVYIRNGLFKRLVPKVYGNACCITGMRLESAFGHSYIDACHIVPFSLTHNDKVNNGLALCPNLHRAFDRGLVSLDQDFKVLVSNHALEDSTHKYALKHFEGQQISMPAAQWHYPASENLAWHRENVFKW